MTHPTPAARGRHATLVDLALAVGVFALVSLRRDPATSLSLDLTNAVQWGDALLAAGAVLARERVPRVALLVTTGLEILTALEALPGLGTHLAWAVTVAVVVRRFPWSRAAWFVVPAAVATLVVFVSTEHWNWFTSTTFAAIEVAAVAIGFGRVMRSRDGYIAALQSRADVAEESREREAQRRVAEDRLRTARDLHDAVAHQIAVINLHAGTASRAIDTRPEDAQAALATIRSASRSVLSEIGALLHDLRNLDSDRTEPRHRVEEVGALVGRFRDAGLDVDYGFGGTGALLDPQISAISYRVAQEALTNAYKHGVSSKPVRLRLTLSDDVITITAANARPVRTSTPLEGHGLRGLRELVASVDGSVAIVNARDRYELSVDLPVTRSVPA